MPNPLAQPAVLRVEGLDVAGVVKVTGRGRWLGDLANRGCPIKSRNPGRHASGFKRPVASGHERRIVRVRTVFNHLREA